MVKKTTIDDLTLPITKEVKKLNAAFVANIGKGRPPGAQNKLSFANREQWRDFMTDEGNDYLKDLIRSKKTPAMVRLLALKEANDRGWGRVPTAKDDDGNPKVTKRVQVTLLGTNNQVTTMIKEVTDSIEYPDSGSDDDVIDGNLLE